MRAFCVLLALPLPTISSMSKTVAIIQSNYIPWKGYFDIINRCDEFILLDNVQYTRRDWRNRNKIKTSSGLKWLTIPVSVKGKFTQNINQTKISDSNWAMQHWQQLKQAYKSVPEFLCHATEIESCYEQASKLELLSDINSLFINKVCELLNIETDIRSASDYKSLTGKNQRLLELCKQAGANVYLSGPAAKGYLDESLFTNEGVEVKWMDYSRYQTYPQRFGEFEHGVSILDVLFNCGAKSPRYALQEE